MRFATIRKIALHWEQQQKCPSKKNNRLVPGNSEIANQGLSPRCSPAARTRWRTTRFAKA